MFPQLPENLGSILDVTELRSIERAFVAAIKTARENLTPEISADLGQALADLKSVRSQIAFAKLSAEADAVEDGDEDEVVDEADPDEAEEDEVEDESVEEDEADAEVEVEEEDEELVPVPAASKPRVPAPKNFKPVTSGRRTPKPKAVPNASMIEAMDNVPGKHAGDTFESWGELANSLLERGETVNPNSGEKTYVGRIKADYGREPGRVLHDDPTFNLARFDQDELVAALCAPFTPYYNLGCMNTTRRPVFNSMPQFQAPRGGVSIYPSPSLSDITDGIGVWTATDDANPTAVKADCQTIECATPVDYVMYAIYRCLTVKNMLQMTFPELLEAYLNRLAAAQARMAEARLLNLMAANVNDITMLVEKEGATESILAQTLRYFTGYQERQRWDFDTVDGWGPRWLLNAIKVDLLHRRNTNGTKAGPVSDSTINGMFRDVGVNMTWFIDQPTWATAFPVVANADATLAAWPSTVELLVAPPGKFALIDRGELRVGVTGNNIYRDISSLKRNDFTFFFESFEGVVDTNSCPADLLKFPTGSLCFNGVQVADVTVDCDLV